MGYRKTPNPNTSYGRKRMRQENEQHKSLITPEERSQQNATEAWVYIIIVVVIGLLIYAIGGSGALLKWATH